MLPPKSRPPLPRRAIPSLLAGQDTRAQAAENRKRITDYLDLLRQQNLSLPAAPQQPNVLGIARISEEAGVSLGVLRPEHPLRKQLEEAIPELGLAIIAEKGVPADQLSIVECRALFSALAPARAVALGIKQQAMQKFIDHLFDLLLARARNDESALALPIVRRMQQDAQNDLLDIDDHVLGILEGFDDWLALRENPGCSLSEDALASMDFRDLLLMGMEQKGLSQANVAALCQIPQATVSKWLAQGRTPNIRSYPGLRRLSRHFGFPEETLIHSIARLKGGKGIRLPLSLFPEQFRDRRSGDLRKSVKAHLTEDDFQLSDEALRQRLARLCEQYQAEREPTLRRKLMRDANHIDRTRFSPPLRNALELYRADLAAQNRSSQTQATYYNFLEGFFHFVLSSHVPARLQPPLGEVSFAYVASNPLWEAYFNHLTHVGRRNMGQDFLISRAMVERMKAISALFNPDRGFMVKHKDIFAQVLNLGEQHLPGFRADHPQILMREIYHELGRFRSEWMRKSKKPTKGRDEIADILSLPDPMIAVRQIISHLREQKSQTRKWMVPTDTGAPAQLNHHYATVSRRLVLIHLLGQTALRIGMIPQLTVGQHSAGAHLQWTEEKPVLKIPPALFKNGQSEAFKEGPYQRVLENIDGFYDDLQEYLDLARPRLLDGGQNDRLFLGWSPKNGCRPTQAAILRNEITQITREAIGLDAPPGKRLIRATHLRPHHFRDILATTVLHRTNRNYALAGDAIHVTESTARAYYAHDSVERRRPELEKVMQAIATNAP